METPTTVLDTCYECKSPKDKGEPVLYGNKTLARIVRHARDCFFRGKPAPGRYM